MKRIEGAILGEVVTATEGEGRLSGVRGDKQLCPELLCVGVRWTCPLSGLEFRADFLAAPSPVDVVEGLLKNKIVFTKTKKKRERQVAIKITLKECS